MNGARTIDQEVSIQCSSATCLTGAIASYGNWDMARSVLFGLQSIISKFLEAVQIVNFVKLTLCTKHDALCGTEDHHRPFE